MDREKRLLYIAVILAALVGPLMFYAANYASGLPSRARLINDDAACHQRYSGCLAAYAHESELACSKHGI